MEITTLKDLLNEGSTKIIHNGLCVHVNNSMIIDGEDRLSYTTALRLIECCRELHWQSDIIPFQKQSKLDSICKAFSANFDKPMLLGSTLLITYAITEIGKRSYHLHFLLSEKGSRHVYATVDMVCVFYDSITHTSLLPPVSIYDHLTQLKDN